MLVKGTQVEIFLTGIHHDAEHPIAFPFLDGFVSIIRLIQL